ncbi:MAG: single-stranded DNA-binding protein [Nocardioidaceae bacterium]
MEPTEIPYENVVRMCGRVAQVPSERTLPSGDRLITMRVIVQRSVRARRRSRVSVDAFECVGWTQHVQRSVARLAPDDIVEIEGELRRRFRRVAGAAVSTVEIELISCRTLAKAS